MDRQDRISALLVSSHAPTTEQLAKLLADRGVHSICTAGNPHDAIDRMAREAFDIVISEPAAISELTAAANKQTAIIPHDGSNRLKEVLDSLAHRHRDAENSRVDAIVERLSAEYLAKVEQNIATLSTAIDAAANDPALVPEKIGRIAKIAHDMKGQGGSFGYPIMSAIAASLVDVCRAVPNPDPAQLPTLSAHIDALRTALAKNMRGEISPEGDALLASLSNAKN